MRTARYTFTQRYAAVVSVSGEGFRGEGASQNVAVSGAAGETQELPEVVAALVNRDAPGTLEPAVVEAAAKPKRKAKAAATADPPTRRA